MEAKQPSQCTQPPIQMGGSQVKSSQTTDLGHLGGWSQGDSMGQEGTCPRRAAAALPPGLTHPRVCLLLQLVPQWHVTNGDMLLLPCFVRSVALIESQAAGISPIHMSAERWRDRDERRARLIMQL
ncbi:hypothetical protein VZT92_008693 [Zoarces viviparus]|uniref:Uncharacterized protein n=1 Tax=Zoarces viviparus TaxID=48416 RepID=A0AAW1FG04_ZOAVI